MTSVPEASKPCDSASPAQVRSREARLASLYAAYATEATRLAYLVTGDRSIAEDICHDAFIRTAGRLTYLRDQSAFRAYFRRAVVNLAKNHFRRKDLERRFASRLRQDAHEDRSGDDVDLMDAVHRLPFRQRAAFLLRYFSGLTEQEAADALRCSTAAINSLVARARRNLQSALGEGDR